MEQPALFLLSGLPGAGKTTFAQQLCSRTGAEHVESDAIRRGIAPEPRYTPRESGIVFALAERRVRAAMADGRSVVLDATNLTNRDRRRFVRAAAEMEATLIAIRVVAPEEVIRERLSGPRAGHSQAGVAVFEAMRGRPQPFPSPVLTVDTRFPIAPAVALAIRLAGG